MPFSENLSFGVATDLKKNTKSFLTYVVTASILAPFKPHKIFRNICKPPKLLEGVEWKPYYPFIPKTKFWEFSDFSLPSYHKVPHILK